MLPDCDRLKLSCPYYKRTQLMVDNINHKLMTSLKISKYQTVTTACLWLLFVNYRVYFVKIKTFTNLYAQLT